MGDSPRYRESVKPAPVRRDGRRVRVALANDYLVVVAGLAALLEPFADRVDVVDWLLVADQPVAPQLALSPPVQQQPVQQQPAQQRRGTDDQLVVVGGGTGSAEIDIVLFDTFGRAGLGLDALAVLLHHPCARYTVLYTGERDQGRISLALERGAAGVLSKSLTGAALVRALECIAAGETVVQLGDEPARAGRSASNWPGRIRGLSERESEVLALITQGLRNQEIAEALYLSVDTVKSHVKAVYRKLGVRNRAGAVSAAFGDESFEIARHDGRSA